MEMDEEGERDWYDDMVDEEMAGPPPSEVMWAVWTLERLLGRCTTEYAEWRLGLPGEAWARQLSNPSIAPTEAEKEFPWTPD